MNWPASLQPRRGFRSGQLLPDGGVLQHTTLSPRSPPGASRGNPIALSMPRCGLRCTRYPGGNTLSDEDKTRLLDVWEAMTPWSDSKAGLTSLRKAFVLATLTNASMAEIIGLVKRETLPFDAILTGELVHAFKPDQRVYRLASEYLGFAPGEIMLVSAHKWGPEGGQAQRPAHGIHSASL
jgi:2-haloalkanoic acid dehalogenase type II